MDSMQSGLKLSMDVPFAGAFHTTLSRIACYELEELKLFCMVKHPLGLTQRP
jgi:hypothetical protein